MRRRAACRRIRCSPQSMERHRLVRGLSRFQGIGRTLIMPQPLLMVPIRLCLTKSSMGRPWITQSGIQNWFGTAGEVTDPTGQWPYSLAAADPAQITIAGGFLALTTINNPITIGFNSYTYRSGHIDTNPSASVASPGFEINPTAGNAVYLEARMYIPPLRQQCSKLAIVLDRRAELACRRGRSI